MNKKFHTYADFKASDRRLRKAVEKISGVYLNHVYHAVDFFMTDGSHNVQIINDILDTADAGRLARNRIVDWLSPIIGHESIKLAGGKYGFGKKLEEFDYSLADPMGHFKSFPDWYSFKPEKAPDAFNAKEAIEKELKRIKKLAETLKAQGYAVAGVTLETFADELELKPLLIKEEEKETA
jgi:hypothetical protein